MKRVFVTTLIYGIITLCFLSLFTGVLGFRLFVIKGESMGKDWNGKCALIVGVIEDIKRGDVILYRFGKALILHRIVGEIEVDGKICYLTKGDANNYIDPVVVCPEDIIGKLVLVFDGVYLNLLGVLYLLLTVAYFLHVKRLITLRKQEGRNIKC